MNHNSLPLLSAVINQHTRTMLIVLVINDVNLITLELSSRKVYTIYFLLQSNKKKTESIMLT